MTYWIITESRHHNVEMPDLYTNVKVKTKNEAILEGYRIAIRSLMCDDSVEIPDISPILTQEYLAISIYDENAYSESYEELSEEEIASATVPILLWNGLDNENRGVGIGTNISDTDKSENRWIKVQKRTDRNLHLAMRGYQHHFGQLHKIHQKRILEILDLYLL